MFRNIVKKLKYGEQGFTLIELLVVVAILGVLAAVAIPNIAQFIGYGREGVGEAELTEMQNCVTALMADKPVSGVITDNDGTPITEPVIIGATDPEDPDYRDDLVVDGKHLTNYIVGGIIKCLGEYSVDQYGEVTQLWYPSN